MSWLELFNLYGNVKLRSLGEQIGANEIEGTENQDKKSCVPQFAGFEITFPGWYTATHERLFH